jgi:hypothetical protein
VAGKHRRRRAAGILILAQVVAEAIRKDFYGAGLILAGGLSLFETHAKRYRLTPEDEKSVFRLALTLSQDADLLRLLRAALDQPHNFERTHAD